MFLECCICKKRIEVAKKDRKYIILSEEFTCSVQCFRDWINHNSNFNSGISSAQTRLHNMFVYPGECCQKVRYRSGYEERVAFVLSHIMAVTYAYEMLGFRLLAGTYTPDFWVYTQNVFIEVKGAIHTGFRTKLKRFRQEYPEVKLLFVPWIVKDQFYRLP